MFAFRVLNVIHLHVGVIFRSVFDRLKAEAIEFFGHGEDAFCNGINGEVGADFVFIESIFFLTHFFGKVVIVPRSDFEIVAHLVGEGLHFGNLLGNFCLCRHPDAHKQIFGSLGSFSHHVVGHICGKIGIAHDGSLLGTFLHDFVDNGTVVVIATLSV